MCWVWRNYMIVWYDVDDPAWLYDVQRVPALMRDVPAGLYDVLRGCMMFRPGCRMCGVVV
jgi:hypothetical protein